MASYWQRQTLVQGLDPNPNYLHQISLLLILFLHTFAELLYARYCDTGFRLRTRSTQQKHMVRFFKIWMPGTNFRPTKSKCAGVFNKWSVIIWYMYGCLFKKVQNHEYTICHSFQAAYEGSRSSISSPTFEMVSLCNVSSLYYYSIMFLMSAFYFII